MVRGEVAAQGIYIIPVGSCGFTWIYGVFNPQTGRVTFQEKTLNPNVCFDDVTVLGYFYNNELDVLNLTIEIENFLWSGTLVRQ